MGSRGLVTADELLLRSLPGRSELVRGRLIVREPAGGRHGAVTNAIAYRLTAFVDARSLGRVYAAETGFKLASDPDTVRAPDVAFVARGRLPEPDPVGFPTLAPDLVVEVLSPGDRAAEVLAKVRDWLAAGTRLVWVVDPTVLGATVYRADGSVTALPPGEQLDGEDVVPGFSCRLTDVL